MTIETDKKAQIRSIRIPDSLWKQITEYHEANRTHSWDSLSTTIRLLITAGLEHLELRDKPTHQHPKLTAKSR